MKILNHETIAQRMRSDANLIEEHCEIDVQDVVANRLKGVKVVDCKTAFKLKKPLLQKLVLPLIGTAVITVIVFNLLLPTVISDVNVQTPLLQNVSIGLVQVDNASTNIDRQYEKKAIKDDISYLTQVFSM